MSGLPEGTWRRRMASAGVSTLRHSRTFARDVRDDIRRGVGGAVPVTYRGWRRSTAPRRSETDHQRRLAADHTHGPEVHVIITGRGDPGDTLKSLESQTWPTWRAGVAGRGTSDDDRVEFGVDPLSALADGNPDDLVVVVDGGDTFRPDAMFRIVDLAWSSPSCLLVHWDDELSGPCDPRIRPSWSPATLLSANYLGRSFAVRRSAARAATRGRGLVGSDLDVWDMLLHLGLDSDSVRRISAVLTTISRRADRSGSGRRREDRR